jgi:hypothetical protein
LQIALVAYPRDLGRHAEQRVRDLAGDHVDLVERGRGDQHLGVLGAGAGEDIGMRGKADDARDVERVGDVAHQVRIGVDHRDRIALVRQVPGDLVPDLTGAADNELHGRIFLGATAGRERGSYAGRRPASNADAAPAGAGRRRRCILPQGRSAMRAAADRRPTGH